MAQFGIVTFSLAVLLSTLLSTTLLTLLSTNQHAIIHTLQQWMDTTPQIGEFHYDPDTYLRNYKCRNSYTVRILHREPTVMVIDDFLQPGEAEHVIQLSYTLPAHTKSG
jgi:hypothetical protein